MDAYRLPQLVRGWESGMVRFLLARLGARGPGASEYGPDAGTGRAPGGGLEDAGLATRLAAAVAKHKLPVLVVHGAGEGGERGGVWTGRLRLAVAWLCACARPGSALPASPLLPGSRSSRRCPCLPRRGRQPATRPAPPQPSPAPERSP